MKYTKEVLDNIHKIQMDILKIVINICTDNDITYFSLGGTTLGAIRDSKIIPWDDDIDIGMFRKDYEKFIHLAKTELPEDYILQHFTTEEKCPVYFAKIRKKNTLFVESYMDDLDIEKGIYIDIKPLDNVPKNKIKFKIYRIKVRIVEQFFLAKILDKTGKYHSGRLAYCGRLLGRKITHFLMMPFDRKYLFKVLENTLRKYANEKTEMVSFRGEWKTLAKRSDYLPVKQHKFEDIYVCVPNNAEKILENQFGKDYMQPKELVKDGHRPVCVKY